MKPFLTLMTMLALAGCSSAAASGKMAGDGAGCTDKAIAMKLAALEEIDPAYITIWAKGMQDDSCRGFSAGLEVTVEGRSDGLACVKSAEDKTCFWVKESMAPGG